jgi:hypothetical protein
VPLFLVRIEEVMSALDEKVSWREWKYLFKLGTSKVVRSLSFCLQLIYTSIFFSAVLGFGQNPAPHLNRQPHCAKGV